MKDFRNPQAKARDKWLNSKEGRECAEGSPFGQYLRNRLERAFLAGFAAAEETEEERAYIRSQERAAR